MHDFLGVNRCVVSEEMSFEIFSLIWSHENKRNEIKKIKNLIEKKKCFDAGSFSPNLALIHLMVSEKTGFTDGQTDGRQTPTS